VGIKDGVLLDTWWVGLGPLGPPFALRYADRETAERDAEFYRQANALHAEATKQDKYKVEPATYTVVAAD
jgi:hypothetical protein